MRSSPLKCRHSVLRPSTPRSRLRCSNDMDIHAHMSTATVTELDLSNPCQPGTIVDRINAVPGLKTSAAFFTFLRANLALQPSAMSSNVSTPNLGPQQITAPADLGTSTVKTTAATKDDDIPPLYIGVLESSVDKVDALNLITDSIAQQRQLASLTLVFHPVCLAVLAAGMAAVYQYAWIMRNQDWGIAMSLGSGAIMTYLLAIRYAAGSYITIAESMTWDWLVGEDGEEDTVIGARYGKEVIGALALRLEPNPGLAGKKKNRSLSLKGGRGVIRGWTTILRYRRKGIGADLLNEAVRVTREKCGKDAEVGFAQEHANSRMVLPEFFNRPFRKREQRAAKALDGVLAGWEGSRRRRYS